MAISFYRPVRQHEGASFTSEYLRLDTPKQKFGGLLGVGNLAHPANGRDYTVVDVDEVGADRLPVEPTETPRRARSEAHGG